MSEVANESTQIWVAVDFGASFSGMAWLHAQDPDAHYILTEGPNTPSPEEIVPTILKKKDGGLWARNFRLNDNERVFSIDDQSPNQGDRGFLSRYLKNPPRREEYDRTLCQELVTEYLKILRQHADQVLENRYTAQLANPKEYIIVLSSPWFTTYIMQLIRECAEAAGMGSGDRLEMISELEAIGIYALQYMSEGMLDVHDAFIICNAGDCTVDIISYTVASLGRIPKVFDNSVPRNELYGDNWLTHKFAEYLDSKFKTYPFWNDHHKGKAVDKFEGLKREFAGDMGMTYSLRDAVSGLPDNRELGINQGSLEFSGVEIGDIFDPIIDEILNLVTSQITSASVTAILLVGSFSRNKYLQVRLEEAIGPSIPVKEVPNGNAAVLRGALLSSNDRRPSMPPGPQPQTFKLRKIAREYYGMINTVPFNATKHDHSRSFIDFSTGGPTISVMDWFLHKGDMVDEDKSVEIPLVMTMKNPQTTITLTIYSYDDPLNLGAPLYKDDGVSKFVDLKIDREIIPVNELEQIHQNGETYYNAVFALELIIHTAEIAFNVIYGDKRTRKPVSVQFI